MYRVEIRRKKGSSTILKFMQFNTKIESEKYISTLEGEFESEIIPPEMEDFSDENEDIKQIGMDLMFPDEDDMEGFDWTLGD